MTEQELDDCKDVFHEKMKAYCEDFEQELQTKYGKQTVRKYGHVVSAFAMYLYEFTDVIRFEDIKKSDTNSKFISATKWDYLYGLDKEEVQIRMKVFLKFLQEQGLENKNIF